MKFCSNDTEESHSCIVSLLGMKSGFFWESQAQKIMGRLRYIIHIDRKTESLWQEDDALCLVGPEVVYYELLKPGETVNTKSYQQLIDLTVRCLKNDQNTKRGKVFMTMLHRIRHNQFGTHWKHSAGKFYPMRLTHQTWLLPIITCLHRWVTHLLSSALVHTKM